MASYTIEDLEYVRRRGGITYEEAVALLDYHNGDVARALVDLERNGKIRPDTANAAPEAQHRAYKKASGSRLVDKIMRTRVYVTRQNRTLFNLPLVVVALLALMSWKQLPLIAILSMVLCVLTGCHINVDTGEDQWNSEGLEQAVKDAAGTVRDTLQSMKSTAQAREPARKEPVREVPVREEPAAETGEFTVDEGPTAFVRELERYEQTQTPDVPVIQMPVRVDTADGSVQVNQDAQGYGTATIE